MKTWAALVTLTAAELNTYLRDNMEYVKGRLDGLELSGVTVSRGSAQSIPNSTETVVSWTAIRVEVNDWWTSGTNVVVPVGTVPGSATAVGCLVFGTVTFTANATGSRRIGVYKNGTVVREKTLSALTGEATEVEVIFFETMDDGDIFTVQAWQSSGGALNATAIFSAIRLGPVD